MKQPPGVVQLPGGIKLEALPFRVLEYNEDGSPKTFELLPRGSVDRGKGGVGIWWLFASEAEIRKRGQAPVKASSGMKDEAWPGKADE